MQKSRAKFKNLKKENTSSLYMGYSINEITAVTGLSLEALEKLDSKTQNG